MPEELDADVTVVDTKSADEDSNETNDDNSSSSDSSSSDSSDNDVIQLTDVQGEDGFRKTEEQLRQDLRAGNTEDLSQAPDSGGTDRDTSQVNTVAEDLATTTEKEKEADVNLSGFQDKQTGTPLTEKEVRNTIAEGDLESLESGPGRRTSRSAILGSRRNRARLLEEKQRNQKQQVKNNPILQRNNNIQRANTSKEKSRQIVNDLAQNIDRPDNILGRKPRPNSITGKPLQSEETLVFSTQRQQPQGTNIPGESIFDTGVSTTGFEFSPNPRARPSGNLAFVTPTEKGFKAKKDTEDLLQKLGLNDQTSRNIGTSIGSTVTLAESSIQGVQQAPNEVKELLQDPEKKAQETLRNLQRASSGTVSKDPKTAALLAGSSFQQQAKLGQEALFGGIALGGLTSAGTGVASGGVVRGVNAPTFPKLSSKTDVETESFQGQFLEDRLDSRKTSVDQQGRVKKNQEFTEIGTRGQTRGVIGEDTTTGISEQPLQFVKVNDPQGQRTFAVSTKTGFEATDEQVKGLSTNKLLEVSTDNELNKLGNIKTSKRVQDFRLENVKDEQVKGQLGDIQLKDTEAAVFGEAAGKDIRGITQTDIKKNRETGNIETFSTSQGAEKSSGKTVNEGLFVKESALEKERVKKVIDKTQDFEDLTSQQKKNRLQNVDDLAEDIFGTSKKDDSQRDTSNLDKNVLDDDSNTKDFEGQDSGSGDQLLVSKDKKSRSEFEEQTLGIGTDRVSRQSAEKAVESKVRDEFSTLKGNRVDELTGSTTSSIAAGVDSVSSKESVLRQEQDQDNVLGQDNKERNIEDNVLKEVQDQKKDQDQGVNNVLGTDQDQTTKEFERDQFLRFDNDNNIPSNPDKGTGFGFDSDNDQDKNKGSNSLFGGSKRFVFRESVGSQALDLEEVSREKALEGSGNPLNLRRGIRGSKRPEDDLL